MCLEVSFSDDFCVMESGIFLPRDLGVLDLSFFLFRLVLGVEIFRVHGDSLSN